MSAKTLVFIFKITLFAILACSAQANEVLRVSVFSKSPQQDFARTLAYLKELQAPITSSKEVAQQGQYRINTFLSYTELQNVLLSVPAWTILSSEQDYRQKPESYVKRQRIFISITKNNPFYLENDYRIYKITKNPTIFKTELLNQLNTLEIAILKDQKLGGNKGFYLQLKIEKQKFPAFLLEFSKFRSFELRKENPEASTDKYYLVRLVVEEFPRLKEQPPLQQANQFKLRLTTIGHKEKSIQLKNWFNAPSAEVEVLNKDFGHQTNIKVNLKKSELGKMLLDLASRGTLFAESIEQDQTVPEHKVTADFSLTRVFLPDNEAATIKTVQKTQKLKENLLQKPESRLITDLTLGLGFLPEGGNNALLLAGALRLWYLQDEKAHGYLFANISHPEWEIEDKDVPANMTGALQNYGLFYNLDKNKDPLEQFSVGLLYSKPRLFEYDGDVYGWGLAYSSIVGGFLERALNNIPYFRSLKIFRAEAHFHPEAVDDIGAYGYYNTFFIEPRLQIKDSTYLFFRTQFSRISFEDLEKSRRADFWTGYAGLNFIF